MCEGEAAESFCFCTGCRPVALKTTRAYSSRFLKRSTSISTKSASSCSPADQRPFQMKMFSVMTAGWMVLSMATAEKINGKLDIVIWLVPGWYSGFDATEARAACGEFFRDHFVIGDESVRLAITDPTNGNFTLEGDILFTEKVRLELTGDFDRFNKELEKWRPNDRDAGKYYETRSMYQQWLTALDRFVFKEEERHRIVIMVDAWATHTVEANRELASTLRREKNIFIYAVVPEVRDDGLEVEVAEACVGKENPYKLILVANETKEDFLDGLIKIKHLITADLCNKKTWCRYYDNSKGKCKQEHFNGNDKEKSALVTPKCKDVKAPNITCIKDVAEDKDDCRDTCDFYWPWANPTDCTKICGHASSRLGKKPDVGETSPSRSLLKAAMEKSLKKHCDHQFNCQPCPVPPSKNLSMEAEKAALAMSDQLNMALWIVLGVIAILLIVTLVFVAGIIVFIKKRNVHTAEHEMKVKAAMQVVNDISLFMSRRVGTEADVLADLQDVEESLNKSTMRLKGMMNSGKSGVKNVKVGSTKPIKRASVKKKCREEGIK